MKKLIVGLFTFVLLLVGQSAFAAPMSYVSWNTHPNDCPDINIKKGTDSENERCWSKVHVNVVPGNNIDVKVYYHNTGDMTATNTRIKVTPSPSVGQSATTHSFISKILSNQASHTSDNNVTATISSSQSLSFVSSTWWTKANPEDEFLTETPLLSGQDGSEVLESNGLYIGNIAQGWNTQGAVVVRFHVNNVVPPTCSIIDFNATPDNIDEGDSSTLDWTVSNCAYTKLFINYSQIGGPYYGTTGSKDVSPQSDTTYTLKAYKSNGTVGDTQDVEVTVNDVPPPQNCSIDYFTATPSQINLGGSSKLEWDTTNCAETKLFAGIKSMGVYNASGSKMVSPVITTTYTLKAYSANGTLGQTRTAKVTITTAPPACSIIDFYADPDHIDDGDSSTLKWTVSNCDNTRLFINYYQIGGPYTGTTGSQNVSPQDTTTYTLKAYKNGTEVTSKTTKVTVDTTVTPACNITYFTADPTTIDPNESSVLEWNTTGCETTKLFIGYTQIGQYGASGSKIVSPEHQTTYTLKAYIGQVEKASSSVTVSINTQDCQIAFFYALPTTITDGEYSILNWNTNDCYNTKLFIGYTQIGTFEPSDSLTVWPDHETTYTLKAYNLNGTVGATAQATIEVETLPACAINNFTASPTWINQGESSTLTWNTSNCESVVISNLDYGVPTSGSQTVWPEDNTTYTLTATGQGGDVHTRSVSVSVNNNNSNCSIYSFYATPSSIEDGQSSRLYWTTNGCTSVNIEGIGQVQSSGSRTIWPTYTRTYTLNAEDYSGIGVSAQTTVYVDEDNNSCQIVNFDASDTSIEDGDETTLEWNTRNCDYVRISDLGNVDDDGEEDVSPNRDTTYVLTAYDYNGSRETESIRIYVDEDSNNNGDECTIDSFTASDTYINRGDEVNLRWRTTDCDDVSITNVGDVSDDGDEDVSPYQTMTYTLRAYGDGSDSKSIRINVDTGVIVDGVYNTYAITTVATNISQTGAQLNGLLTGQSYTGGNTYFEYGTTVNLGMRTASRMTTGNNTFSEYVTNLNSGTIYYFRAVAEGQYGLSYGSIEVFQTLRYQANNNTQIIRQVIQGPTIAGSESPIMLQIENRYQTISVGDAIDYTVFYKNISSSRLNNPMVQVFLPEGIEFVNSSRGTYSDGDKTLSVPIDDLKPDDEGTIYIQAVVRSLDRNMAQIVTTAVLIYTNPNGAQENAMAYVLNSPRGNVLGASAFFGNIWGMSLIGWLLLIIVILLLVLIARSYYGRRNLLVSPFHGERNHQ